MSATAPVGNGPSPAAAQLPGEERRFEHHVAEVLLGGVALAASIVAIGLVDLAVRPEFGIVTSPVHFDLRTFFGSLAAGDPYAIFLLGLLVLVATPFVRVGLSIASFSASHDRAFVAMTVFVIAVLAFVAIWGG
jgi:uncharacterized membrane protein